MRLKTEYPAGPGHRPLLKLDDLPQLFCGYTHCDGNCGFPAIVMTDPAGQEWKAQSAMVACGSAWKRLDPNWKGAKHPVSWSEKSFAMMWW